MRICPMCSGEVIERKCRLVCAKCHALISNCNGD